MILKHNRLVPSLSLSLLSICACLWGGCPAAAESCRVSEAPGPNGLKLTVMENEFVRLAISPKGGRVVSLIHKRSGYDVAKSGEGLLMDFDYSTKLAQPSDFADQMYIVEVLTNTPERSVVSVKGQSKRPPLNWIEITKTIRLEQGSSLVKVDYRYFNHPDAMMATVARPWIHNEITTLGLADMRLIMPVASGLAELKLGKDVVQQYGPEPAQGWLAAVKPGGNGLVCFMPLGQVHQHYQWLGPTVGTLEWQLVPLEIPNGQAIETSCSLLPIAGLATVCGGAEGVAGGLPGPAEVKVGEAVPFRLELFAGAALAGVTVDARARSLRDGTWKIIGEKTCSLAPDSAVTLDLGAWTPDAPGTWVIQSRVSANGKKLFDAERTVTAGSEPTPGYILANECAREGDANLVRNPQAESAAHWDMDRAAFDEQVCHSGRGSIKAECINDPKNRSMLWQTRLPVQPSSKYVVSLWVKCPIADRCYLKCTAFDKQGKPVLNDKEHGKLGFGQRSHEWARYEMQYETPPDTATLTLYIYGFGRTVRFWVDDLSLVPGEAGADITPQQADIPYTLDVATPHVPWARPYSRGPIKALILVHGYNGRDIIELAQRLELDFETVTIGGTPGASAYMSGSMKKRRVEDEQQNILDKLAQPYEAIVLGDIPWEWIGKNARQAIMKQVMGGAGLVYVNPTMFNDELLNPAGAGATWPMTPAAPEVFEKLDRKNVRPFRLREHPIVSGLPLRLFFPLQPANWLMGTNTLAAYDQATPMLAVGQYGQGRVAALNYITGAWPYFNLKTSGRHARLFENNGLFPGDRNVTKTCRYPYWEYIWATLARTVAWAAGKEPEVEVLSVEPDAGLKQMPPGPRQDVAATFRSPRPIEARVAIDLHDEYGAELAREEQAVKLAANAPVTVRAKIPGNAPAGLLVARFILRDAAGKSLNWAATAFENPKPIRFAAIALDRADPVYRRGDKVSATVKLAGDLAGATLLLEVVDTYGRLILRRTEAVEGPETALELDLAHPRSVRMAVRGTVLQGGRVMDRAETRFTISPAKSPWDQYQFVITGMRANREYLKDAMYKLYLEHGFTCVRGYDPLGNADHNMNFLANVGGFGDVRTEVGPAWSRYLQTGDLQHLERNPPAYDPERWEKLQAKLEKEGAFYAQVSPLIYGFGDENNLGGQVCDYDYSKPTLDRFRQWLREQYETLANLNRQWETKFATWEEVMPMPLPEAKKRSENLSPWADHREFMDWLFADFHAQAKAALRKGDPNAIGGISGTQHPDAYNGYDWWKLMQIFDALLAYTRGNQAAIQRSFKRVPSTAWGGYANTGPAVERQFWSSLLYNKHMGLWRDWLVYEPDWRLCQSGKDYIEASKPLMNGIGKLVMQSEWIPAPVAIHYSQASIRAAAGGKRALAFEEARGAWVALLEDLGLQPMFLSYEQLAQGKLDPRRFRVLILPESEAMSAAECRAARAFAEAGGTVIADTRPALRDEHCRLLPAGQLDDFFGIKRAAAPAAPASDARKIELRDGAAIEWPLRQLVASLADNAGAIVPDSGEALGNLGGAPCFIIRPAGSGRAVYLNMNLPVYPRLLAEGDAFRAVFRALLAAAGVTAPVNLAGGDGKPFSAGSVTVFRNGSEELVAILGDMSAYQFNNWQEIPVTVRFPEKKWVYDAVAGEALGQVDEVSCKLSSSRMKLYALLPGKAGAIKVSGPGSAQPGEVPTFQVKVEGDLRDRQLARIEVTGPDGRRRPEYSTILWIPVAGASYEIPLALNDAPGAWTIKAAHVVGGLTSEHKFTVRP